MDIRFNYPQKKVSAEYLLNYRLYVSNSQYLIQFGNKS